MDIITDLRPLTAPVSGELVIVARAGGTAIAIVEKFEDGMARLILLASPREDEVFTRRLVQPEKNWGTYGTDWQLELLRGPATGITVSPTVGPFIMLSAGFDGLVLHLDTWVVDASYNFDGLIHSGWRIWASKDHKQSPGARPVVEWSLPNAQALVDG